MDAANRWFLYNTCSIREKAAQKVFSRLGEFRPVESDRRSATSERGKSAEWRVTSGELAGSRLEADATKDERLLECWGAVAQQEGERIFARAPWVSLVCGSASYRKLPQLFAQLEAGERRVTGLDTDTDETFETRGDAAGQSVAGVSDDYRGMRQGMFVLRGAIYARAGAEPGERVDIGRGAEAGGCGVHGSAAAGADGEFVRGPSGAEDAIFGIAGGGGGSGGDSAREIYDFAPAGFWKGYCGSDRGGAGHLRARAFAGAERVDEGAAGDGADVYAGGISGEDCDGAGGETRDQLDYGYYCGISGRDGEGF